MTDSTYTHFILLVDRTGSMSTIAAETEQGIRNFVQEQKSLPGKVTMSLHEFDAYLDGSSTSYKTQLNTVCGFAPLADVPDYKLVPRGNTPLYDAQGMVITDEGTKLAALPEQERPSKVIMVTATDGQENWSSEWTAQRVRDLIAQQERDYGWTFIYLGANQDAFDEGGKMGVSHGATLPYAATASGTTNAWVNSAKMSNRVARGMSAGFTDEEREQSAR